MYGSQAWLGPPFSHWPLQGGGHLGRGQPFSKQRPLSHARPFFSKASICWLAPIENVALTLFYATAEQGVTIIVVTHEVDIAAYADRVLTMRDGQVISDEQRRPRQVRQEPVALPVAAQPIDTTRLSTTF
jgi:hypothetical protein